MKETLQRQQELYKEIYGVPMSAEQLNISFKLLTCLQGLYFMDEPSVAGFSDTAYWEELSGGNLHVSKGGLQPIENTGHTRAAFNRNREVRHSGICCSAWQTAAFLQHAFF
jgi:hypothetical protein